MSCIEYDTTRPAAHWALIHGKTGDDPWADYVALCQSCHFRYDGVTARKRGIPRSPETRAAISASKTGQPTHRKTQDEKNRISAKLRGRRSPTTGMRFPGVHGHQPRDKRGRYK